MCCEIGTQFPDSKNAQRNLDNARRNLEMAQIPKLHGTARNIYIALTLPASTHLVSMTTIGSRFSQIIRQKSAVVLGRGPGR